MPTHLRRLLATAAVAALAVVAAPDRAGADDSSDEDESIDVSALVDRVRSIRRTSRDIRNTSDERPTTVDAAVDEAGHDPDAVFDWVDEEIDFVPYKGSMRGPTGALEAGAANAVDRARLLASMFENLGLKTRFASARLDRQTAAELIRKYTGRAKLVATDEVDAESIESANTAGFADRFRGLVRRHVWVEIRRPDDDGDWIAADPLLTDELGSPTVEAERHFESIDERHAAHLTISLEADFSDGQHKTLYTLEGPLPELAYRPITVEFTSAADLENQLVPEITIGETTETGVRFVPDKLDSLRITYHSVIGERERHYRQPLFRNPERERRLLRDDVTLSLLVAPGRISGARLADIAGRRLETSAESLLETLAGQETVASSDAQSATARVGRVLGTVAPLLYSRHLDRMTDELGPVMGVRPLLLQPRLFRTVVVSSENEFTVDIDTRGGRLEAVPLAGMPESAATGFLTLYGRAESQLRRALLRKITGRTDVSVGELFRRVRREHVPVVTVHRDNLDRLMDLDLPDHTRKRMRQQVVQRGWLLLAPTAPLETTSGPEFGWWSVAPQSGLLRGNLGTALSDIQLAGQSTGRPGRTVFAAVDILRRSANAVDQTLDSASAYDGLVCSGLEDTILVARSMCATTQLLSLPKTAECVATPDADDNGEGSGPAAIDLGARSCRSRAAKIRCGAAIAEAFLKGKLAAVRGGDEAKSRELNCLE